MANKLMPFKEMMAEWGPRLVEAIRQDAAEMQHIANATRDIQRANFGMLSVTIKPGKASLDG